MDERELEKRLRGAIERTAPDGLERLLSEVKSRKGETPMEKKKKNRWIGLVAAVLALALIGGAGGLYYRQNYAVATVVSLDVNPSIELQVNRSEKVISCAGLNAEGKEILSSMNGGADLKGSKLSVAVNAVVGAIVRAGYLDSLSSAILISVEDNDQTRGERIQAQLVAEVDEVLKAAANSAGVLSQSMTPDKTLDKQAQENNISSGKAALVNEVLALNPDLDFAALSKLSVEELRELIRIGAPAMPIGRDAAAQAAMEYAGVSLLDSYLPQYAEVDPELDDLTPHYDVELNYVGQEYEYEIDAFTGEVLRGQYWIIAPDTTGIGRVLTADEAFNAAAERFKADYPELQGYNIFDIDTEYKAVNNTYEVEFDVAGWDFKYVIDAATGDPLRSSSPYIYYRTSQSGAQDPTDGTAPTQPDAPPTPTEPVTPPTEQPTPVQPSDIGADAAKAAALQKAGIADESAVTWLKCQREYDDGRLEYDIEFVSGNTEYDVTVDAATGSILKYETESRPGAQTGGTGDIGSDQAVEIAFAHAGLTRDGVTRLKSERDYDDGRLVYEVEFRSGRLEYEYKIDASTGAILEHESDWDD